VPAYSSIKDLKNRLAKYQPSEYRDWSVDLALHLALASLALDKLAEYGVDLKFQDRELVRDAIEMAWRDLLYMRLNRVPEHIMLSDVRRPVTITRAGRIVNEDQFAVQNFRDAYRSGAEFTAPRKTRDVHARHRKRVRARRAAEPAQTGNADGGAAGGQRTGD